MDIRNVILSPIVTEKSMQDASLGRFTFKVVKDASKTIIKKAIEEKFKVKVVKTYVSIIKGKRNRVGIRRVEIDKTPYKKAIVKLQKGQKIGLFDAGEKKE